MKKEYHIHRKIYQEKFGPIPKDEKGRSYEIHHIDGNHKNNNIENLQCVTIEEHYDIHKKQGDYAACLLISRAMRVSPEEKSELLRLHNKKMVEKGTHPFQNKEKQRERQLIKVIKNEHHWQRAGHAEMIRNRNLEKSLKKIHPWNGGQKQRKRQLNLVLKGKHPWQDKEKARLKSKKMIKEGTHNFQKDGFYESISKKFSKKFEIKFPNGEVKKVENLTKFCKENNLHKRLLNNVLCGKQKSHKGFQKP